MRIDHKNDRLVNDVLGLSTDLVGQDINHLFDLLEVCELLSRNFIKFSPGSYVCACMIKSKLEGSSRDDTITSWQKVQSYD